MYAVVFLRVPGCESPTEGLDPDGLPPVGKLLTDGDPMYR